jgi:hypothetical protein
VQGIRQTNSSSSMETFRQHKMAKIIIFFISAEKKHLLDNSLVQTQLDANWDDSHFCIRRVVSVAKEEGFSRTWLASGNGLHSPVTTRGQPTCSWS